MRKIVIEAIVTDRVAERLCYEVSDMPWSIEFDSSYAKVTSNEKVESKIVVQWQDPTGSQHYDTIAEAKEAVWNVVNTGRFATLVVGKYDE